MDNSEPDMTPEEASQAFQQGRLSILDAITALDGSVNEANVDIVLRNLPERLRREVAFHYVLNFQTHEKVLDECRRTGVPTATREAIHAWVLRNSAGGVTWDEFSPDGQARLAMVKPIATECLGQALEERTMSFRDAFYAFLGNLTDDNVNVEFTKLPRDLKRQFLDAVDLNRLSFAAIFEVRQAASNSTSGWRALRRWFLRNTHHGVDEVEFAAFRRNAGTSVEQLLKGLPRMTSLEIGQSWRSGGMAFLDAFYKFLESINAENVNEEAARLPTELRRAIDETMLAYRWDHESILKRRLEEARALEPWQALREWAERQSNKPQLDQLAVIQLEVTHEL